MLPLVLHRMLPRQLMRWHLQLLRWVLLVLTVFLLLQRRSLQALLRLLLELLFLLPLRTLVVLGRSNAALVWVRLRRMKGFVLLLQ